MIVTGWTIAVSRCQHLETAEDANRAVFAVNLVQPFWESPGTDPVIGPAAAEVPQGKSTLFFPWRWMDVKWRAFGYKTSSAGVSSWVTLDSAKPDSSASPQLEESDVELLRAQVEAEISEPGCEYPLSRAIEHFLNRRSLAHSLAALTVWPELMSRHVLSQTLFIEIDISDLEDVREVVCFPEFSCKGVDGGDRQQTIRPDTLSLQDDVKAQVRVGYSPTDTAFLCYAAKPNESGLDAVTLQLSQGAVDRAAFNEELYALLSPASLLRHWLSRSDTPLPALLKTDAPLRNAFGDVLWRLLGDGTDIGQNALGSASDGRSNVVEFLVSAKHATALPKLTNTLLTFDFSQAEPRTKLQRAVDRMTEESSSDTRSAWTQVQESLQYVNTASAEDFPVHWQRVATALLDSQRAADLYGPWLASLLVPAVLPQANDTDAHADSDMKALSAELTRFGRVRLVHWQRGRLAAISQSQWQAARALLQPLLQGQPPAGIATALKTALTQSSIDQVKAHLGAASAALPTVKLEAVAGECVDTWITRAVELLEQHTSADRTRPMDRGLRLHFAGQGGTNDDVNRLRGYAIALCAGVKLPGADDWRPDLSRAAWLTDTAAQYRPREGSPMTWLDLKGGELAWMHETLGATDNDGEPVVERDYTGQPLAAGVSNSRGELSYDDALGDRQDPGDLDGFKAVNFAWNKARGGPLPLLGFGLSYRGVASPIDNAGGVVDVALRRDRTLLCDAKVIDAFQPGPALDEACQYLCHEPPGAPTLVDAIPDRLLELSDETRAEAFQRSQALADRTAAAPEKVALLSFDSTLFLNSPGKVELRVRPPGAPHAFIERWIATDRVLLATATKEEKEKEDGNPSLSDPAFNGLQQEILGEFAEQFRQLSPGAQDGMRHYHPAVAALGVEVWAPGMESEQVAAASIVVPITQLVAAGGHLEMKPRSAFEAVLTIRAVAGDTGVGPAPVPTVTVDGRMITVDLPQSGFARVRLRSLIRKRFFDDGGSTDGRFAAGIQRGAVSVDQYVGFGHKELWFETLPAWNPDLKVEKNQLQLVVPRTVNGRIENPDSVEAKLDLSTKAWAAWIKGVQWERHEWHWTGYPVSFPNATDLADWQRVMPGTQTYRASGFAAFAGIVDDKGTWKLGADGSNQEIFHRHGLPKGRRPARYMAVLARPVVRFRRWMNGRDGSVALLEQSIWGGGGIVAGRGAETIPTRLPAPAMRQTIPLTATYDPSNPTRRLPNGVLVVLDEALRRTDDLALVGGIGETLEVDVLDTRLADYAELGVNPAMHAMEPSGARLQTLAPVGLTFDIGRNPQVAQTGLIIYPEDARGRWMLGKVRLRRFMLPEVDLDSTLSPEERPESQQTPGPSWLLRHRAEGAERVPPDLAIDLAEGTASVSISYGGKEPATVRFPALQPADGPTRYVLSWHRDRWGGAECWRRPKTEPLFGLMPT